MVLDLTDFDYQLNPSQELKWLNSAEWIPENMIFEKGRLTYELIDGVYYMPLPSVRFNHFLRNFRFDYPTGIRRITDSVVRNVYCILYIRYAMYLGYSSSFALYSLGISSKLLNSVRNVPIKIRFPRIGKRLASYKEKIYGISKILNSRKRLASIDALLVPDKDELPESGTGSDITKSKFSPVWVGGLNLTDTQLLNTSVIADYYRKTVDSELDDIITRILPSDEIYILQMKRKNGDMKAFKDTKLSICMKRCCGNLNSIELLDTPNTDLQVNEDIFKCVDPTITRLTHRDYVRALNTLASIALSEIRAGRFMRASRCVEMLLYVGSGDARINEIRSAVRVYLETSNWAMVSGFISRDILKLHKIKESTKMNEVLQAKGGYIYAKPESADKQTSSQPVTPQGVSIQDIPRTVDVLSWVAVNSIKQGHLYHAGCIVSVILQLSKWDRRVVRMESVIRPLIENEEWYRIADILKSEILNPMKVAV